MVSVIDHQFCLTAIDTDILAGDETSLVGCQKQHHIGDIQRIAHPARWLLDGIGAFVNRVGGVDPSGADGVDPDFSGKRNCQRMGQGGDAAFCGCVAFALGLTHPVTGGGNIDDAGTLCEIEGEQFA